jgi:hypothetical protein
LRDVDTTTVLILLAKFRLSFICCQQCVIYVSLTAAIVIRMKFSCAGGKDRLDHIGRVLEKSLETHLATSQTFYDRLEGVFLRNLNAWKCLPSHIRQLGNHLWQKRR